MKKQELFHVSVDPVIFSISSGDLKVLVYEREANNETFGGFLALPGGLIKVSDETLESAVSRVLHQKTGVKINYQEQLLSRSGHDPRGPTLSIAYMALTDDMVSDPKTRWLTQDEVLNSTFAFDHKEVIEKGFERLSNKVNYSMLPIHFLPQPFTLPKLQAVYETILGEKLNKSTFREKMESSGMIKDTGEKIKEGAYRPSSLYCLNHPELHVFQSNIKRRM